MEGYFGNDGVKNLFKPEMHQNSVFGIGLLYSKTTRVLSKQANHPKRGLSEGYRGGR